MRLPPPRYGRGYTKEEVLTILRWFKVHHARFWKAFGVNTCGVCDCGKTVYYYPCDVERALAEILKYRKVSLAEFD
jgi:hypothetical protein